MAGVVCSHFLDEVGKTRFCSLTSSPIPIGWGYCFSQPQNCPRVQKYAAGSVAIKDSDSEDLLDIDEIATQTTLAALLTELQAKPDDLEFTGCYQDTVAAAGTAENLANHSCVVVLLQALSTNTQTLYWGFSNATCFYELEAGESASIPCSNSNKIWIDVDVNGEGATFGTWE